MSPSAVSKEVDRPHPRFCGESNAIRNYVVETFCSLSTLF